MAGFWKHLWRGIKLTIAIADELDKRGIVDINEAQIGKKIVDVIDEQTAKNPKLVNPSVDPRMN